MHLLLLHGLIVWKNEKHEQQQQQNDDVDNNSNSNSSIHLKEE
jgi:hypothetical protein